MAVTGRLPEVSLGSSIHRGRGLIEKQQGRAPNQRNRQAQLALGGSDPGFYRVVPQFVTQFEKL